MVLARRPAEDSFSMGVILSDERSEESKDPYMIDAV